MSLILSFVAGVILGMLFFGGLWWTIRKCVSAKQPALWILGSLLLRTSIVLVSFYFVALGHWERFLVCLLGFVIARVVVMRLLRGQAPERPQCFSLEVSDASYP